MGQFSAPDYYIQILYIVSYWTLTGVDAVFVAVIPFSLCASHTAKKTPLAQQKRSHCT